jgi:hypothetical protein
VSHRRWGGDGSLARQAMFEDSFPDMRGVLAIVEVDGAVVTGTNTVTATQSAIWPLRCREVQLRSSNSSAYRSRGRSEQASVINRWARDTTRQPGRSTRRSGTTRSADGCSVEALKSAWKPGHRRSQSRTPSMMLPR